MDELEFNAIGKALTSALAEAKKATEKWVHVTSSSL